MTVSDRPFQFIGVSPFVDQAAEALGLADERLKGKAKSIEHLGRIQTALGQTAQASAESRQAIFDQALAFRNSLAVALLAAELAISDVAGALDLEAPNTLGERLSPPPIQTTEGLPSSDPSSGLAATFSPEYRGEGVNATPSPRYAGERVREAGVRGPQSQGTGETPAPQDARIPPKPATDGLPQKPPASRPAPKPFSSQS